MQASSPGRPGALLEIGGCKDEADVGERPAFTRHNALGPRGNVGAGTVTGGADVQQTNQPICMRKGSYIVRASQARAL